MAAAAPHESSNASPSGSSTTNLPTSSSGTISLSKALAVASAWLDGDESDYPPLNNDYDDGATKNNIGPNDDDNNPPQHHHQHDITTITGTTTTNTDSIIERAISLLLEIQAQMSSRSMTISKNESLEDVSTLSLELMSVSFHLGRAYLMLPTNNNNNNNNTGGDTTTFSYSSSSISRRKQNVTQAMEYFHSFLRQLDQLAGNDDESLLSEGTLKEYHSLLESEQPPPLQNGHLGMDDDDVACSLGTISSSSRRDPNRIRTAKIQRHHRKQAAQTRKLQLESLARRRTRLGVSDAECLDGHDGESLARSLHLETLLACAEEALEELSSSTRELEMIELSLRMMPHHHHRCDDRSGEVVLRDGRVVPPSANTHPPPSRPSDAPPPPPLQMTQITQNPITGQLQIAKRQVADSNGGRAASIHTAPLLSNNASTTTARIQLQRQQIKEGVFRPGWNLPTMSLEELAHRETIEAMRRSEAQKIAEAEAIYRPRRYDQLERDGMEDDADLVEASARLDREWDSWKEENPRGCGNKLGERGDRNF